MRRFAFIDVQNTETTTLKVLGFTVDHIKLFLYLKNIWKCEKVFFYPGIEHGDAVRTKLFDELAGLGAIIRPKHFLKYRNSDMTLLLHCPTCNTDTPKTVHMGYSWKCNCDVELAIDVIENATTDSEIFIFSGDGDFQFLIEKIVTKGSFVAIVSSAKMIQKGPRRSVSRLSTKLRKLTQGTASAVRFIEIDNLRLKIEK